MLKAVLDFTGLSEKFNPTQIPVTIGNIIAQYAGLKATELMHFVFLMQNGEYEEFFGNPNGAKLMKSLKRYFEEVCQPSRARYLKAMEREKSEIERTREKAANCGYSAEMLAQQIAEEFSEENQARMREWRLEPWATAMCRAFSSVDKPEWTAKPWEWTYDQRKAWAVQNADLVKAFPNLNIAS
ncbi:MAG: hypothetical protein LIP09_11960 [Bacteroidales bacterium]|nr:hypothetical protein [Bacteroidales bacterium]